MKTNTILSCVTFLILCFLGEFVLAQRERPLDAIAAKLEPSRFEIYKTVGRRELRLHLFEPDGLQKTDRRSVFLVIHGGGWTGGTPRWFYPMADHFAQQGMLGISLEYRLMNKKLGTTVFDCVEDARDAVRYLREHAKDLGIDPDRIVVAGASAGGHLAVSTSVFDAFKEGRSGAVETSRADALVLLYPVIDTSEDGYGQKKIGDRWRELSPVHNVTSNMPPTLLFHGTADTVTPHAGAAEFHRVMKEHGNQCELISHPDGIHGYLIFDLELYNEGIKKIEKFLVKEKFLDFPDT